MLGRSFLSVLCLVLLFDTPYVNQASASGRR
jgi:hypothetical protein